MRYDKHLNNTRKFYRYTLIIPRYSYEIYQYYSNRKKVKNNYSDCDYKQIRV